MMSHRVACRSRVGTPGLNDTVVLALGKQVQQPAFTAKQGGRNGVDPLN